MANTIINPETSALFAHLLSSGSDTDTDYSSDEEEQSSQAMVEAKVLAEEAKAPPRIEAISTRVLDGELAEGMAAKLGDQKFLSRIRFAAAKIPSPSQKVTVKDIKRELARLESEQMHHYISKFDIDSPENTILEILQGKYQDSKLELIPIDEGVTSTKLVLVDGIAKHILKSNCLPGNIDWKTIRVLLESTGRKNLSEQVYELFFKQPHQVVRQEFPHFNNVQREKLAYIIGASLGVPKTDVIRAQGGVFSLHDFVPNRGSARTFDILREDNQAQVDVQSLQNIGILDILLESQDRNAGNIMIQKGAVVLVPIDHALSLQKVKFDVRKNQDIKKPIWTKLTMAKEFLTGETIDIINALNPDDLVNQLLKNGIAVDVKIARSIYENVAFLKYQIRGKKITTLLELYESFYKKS